MSLLFRCLASLTDAALADAMVGDLEELRRRRRGTPALAATIWFWRTALGIVLHVAGERLRSAVKGIRTSSGGTNGVGGDLRQALRGLRRRRGYATAIIVLLTLGIGANTAVFSIVYAVVLKPLPYRDLDRLVYVWRGTETRAGNRHSIQTGSRIHEIARHNTTLESFAVTKPWDTAIEGVVDIVFAEGSERLRGASVTPNFFELLGVNAQLGRAFASRDNESAPAAVISHSLWRRLFGSHPGVIGRQVRLARGSMPRTDPAYTIVGVLPAEIRFTYPRETEIYLLLPWSRIPATGDLAGALEYTLIARLRSGVTPRQAEDEMTAIAVNSLRARPGFAPDVLASLIRNARSLVEPMQEHVSAEVRPGAWLLAGVVGLVFVIACVNVALLSLASGVDRTGELAVRAALGAGTKRILRLLFVEHALLAVIGATAGLALAAVVLPTGRALLPDIVPRAEEITIDTRVVFFAGGLAMVAAFLSGIIPAAFTLRRDLLAAVKRSGVTTTDRTARRWRSIVVTVQVAIVVVLLVGTALLVHSFWRIQRVDLGFAGNDLLTFETRFYNPAYRQLSRVATFEEQLLEQVKRLPGVEMASLSTAVPMRGVDFRNDIGPRGGPMQTAHMRSVTPDYFRMLGIPLRAGRTFTPADKAGAPDVVVISEALATTHFGTFSAALGQRLLYGEKEHEVIGVVGEVRYAEVVRDPAPAFYTARAQNPTRLICLLVRPRPGMANAVAESLRGVVSALDPEQPIQGLTTVGEIIAESTADRRFYAFITTAFGSIALILAIAGLFGAVARTVGERRRELAIRSAIGAGSPEIVRMVMGYGLIPVLTGTAIGVAAAVAVSRFLAGFLFEVRATDAPTYLAAAVLVLTVGLLACLIPARRALRFEPASLLRE